MHTIHIMHKLLVILELFQLPILLLLLHKPIYIISKYNIIILKTRCVVKISF